MGIEYIRNIEHLSIQEIRDEVEKGARFVVYRYRITILWSFGNFSDVYFFETGDDSIGPGIKYSLWTFLLGWYGPLGFAAFSDILVNLRGGENITDMVMEAIDIYEKNKE